MTDLPPDAWVPVPIRWRHVVPGDVVVFGSALWLVTLRPKDGEVHGQRTFHERHQGRPDPDDAVQVLIPVTERDAVELTREQLGARLVAGRTA